MQIKDKRSSLDCKADTLTVITHQLFNLLAMVAAVEAKLTTFEAAFHKTIATCSTISESASTAIAGHNWNPLEPLASHACKLEILFQISSETWTTASAMTTLTTLMFASLTKVNLTICSSQQPLLMSPTSFTLRTLPSLSLLHSMDD